MGARWMVRFKTGPSDDSGWSQWYPTEGGARVFDQLQRQQKYAALFGLFNELPVNDGDTWTKEQIESWVGAVQAMAMRSVPQEKQKPTRGKGKISGS